MNTNDKIHYLQSICKESVSIFINSHHDNHESIQDYLSLEVPDLDKQIVDKMIDKNVIYQVIAYPGTQVGSYRSFHFDLDEALDQVISGCKEYHKIS